MLIAECRLLLLAVFRDINNLVLEDEQIRSILARHAHHILVVVLDPAPDHFAVGKLQAHDLLLFPERLPIGRLFTRFIRKWSALLVLLGNSRSWLRTLIL